MKKVVAFASTVAFLASAVPAFASFSFGSSSDIDINSNNWASVSNNVVTVADTGLNNSVGGVAESRAYGKGAESQANGGDGGDVTSGNAEAFSFVTNVVNSNTTKVTADCGCKGDVKIKSKNGASVGNNVGTSAFTGGNGSFGGAGVGKAVSNSSSYHHYGNSGAESKANGGDGGSVDSGNAASGSSVMNVVNSNVTRVRR
jgi:hypothetical protein